MPLRGDGRIPSGHPKRFAHLKPLEGTNNQRHGPCVKWPLRACLRIGPIRFAPDHALDLVLPLLKENIALQDISIGKN